MSLGTALGSAFDTFTGIQNHQRKSELHGLQKEQMSLRNQGHRLDNRYKKSTLDTRIDREHSATEQQEHNTDYSKFRSMLEQQKQEFDLLTQDVRRETLEHNRDYAGNRSVHMGNQALSSGLTAQRDAALQNERITAERAELENTATKNAQEARARALGGTVAKYNTAEELLHDSRFMGAVISTAENDYGQYIRDTYGENASVAGYMQDENDPDSIVFGIDVNGDGEADELLAETLSLPEVLIGVMGEDAGRSTYDRLRGGSELTDEVVQTEVRAGERAQQGAGANQLKAAEYAAQIPRVQELTEKLATLESNLEAVGASNATPVPDRLSPQGGVDPDAQDNQFYTSGRDNRDAILELQSQKDDLLAQAEEEGLSQFLKKPSALSDLVSAYGHRAADNNSFAEDTGSRVRDSRADLNRRLSATGDPSAVAESRIEDRDRAYVTADEWKEGIDIEGLLTSVDENHNTGKRSNFVSDSEVAKMGVQIDEFLADSLTNPHNKGWVARLVEAGERGKQAFKTNMSRGVMYANKHNVTFDQAMQALTGEGAQYASETGELRNEFQGSSELANVMRHSGVNSQSAALDQIVASYVWHRSEGNNRNEAKTKALQEVLSQGR